MELIRIWSEDSIQSQLLGSVQECSVLSGNFRKATDNNAARN